MKIQNEFIQRVLEKYKPNYRYLKEAEIEFPLARGIFKIHETEYMEDLQHLTDVETQLCLNQLCYVFFAQGVIEKKWKEIGSLTLEEYLDLEKEHMYIIESSRKFNKKIDSKKDIYGEIQLMKTKKYKDLSIAKINYSFNSNACVGKLMLGLKL